MTKLIIFRAGRTDWDEQGRLVGDLDMSLNESGRTETRAAAAELASLRPQTIFSGTDAVSRETAGILAESLGLKPRVLEEFRELDLGFWEGLTHEQVGERFGKVYKAWRDDPSTVEPPNGESIPIVAARLKSGMARVLKRKAAFPAILVLGRLAYATARCRYVDRTDERFWEYAESPVTLCTIEPEAVGPIQRGKPPGPTP